MVLIELKKFFFSVTLISLISHLSFAYLFNSSSKSSCDANEYDNCKKIKVITTPYITSVTNYIISLFVVNQETVSNSLKYIITDNLDAVDGEITTSIYRSDLSNIGKQISKTLDDGGVEFKLNDKITYKLSTTGEFSSDNNPKTYTLYKYNTDTNKNTIINNNIPYSVDTKDINLTFIDENLGFLSIKNSYNKQLQLLRTEDGGKTFSEATFENPITESLEEKHSYSGPIEISEPYKQNNIIYIRLQLGENPYTDKHYSLYISEDNGKTWSLKKTVRYFTNTEDHNFIKGGWFIKITFTNTIQLSFLNFSHSYQVSHDHP